jgi:geranylgeranyl pyrophosphate synthase
VPDFWKFLRLFDVLRQIINETSDVTEDANQGIITLPMMYYFTKYNKNGNLKITAEWERNGKFDWLHNELRTTGAFEDVFQLGQNIYSKCFELKENLKNSYPFINHLFILYDMRIAVLYRIKSEGWMDNKKDYK